MKNFLLTFSLTLIALPSYAMKTDDVTTLKYSPAGDAIHKADLTKLKQIILSKQASSNSNAFQKDLQVPLLTCALEHYRFNLQWKANIERAEFHRRQVNLQDIIKFLLANYATVTDEDLANAQTMASRYQDPTLLDMLSPHESIWCLLQ